MKVLMFGALAEAAARRDDFDLPDGSSVGTLVAAVRERYPAAAAIVDRCRVAVNHEIVGPERTVTASDEVALLPPVSGGSVWVRIGPAPSVGDALAAVGGRGAGGTVTFVGTVRPSCELGEVVRLEYSAYEPMASKVLAAIAGEAVERFALCGAAIDHAVGSLRPDEVTFVVACSAPRRDAAFEASRVVVDEVKARAPIWKKEIGEGWERWVNL